MTMESMLPMMMMMGMGGSGSENGKDSGSGNMGELIKLMMGQQDELLVEALFASGALGGTAKDRSGDATVGVLEVMVVPPHVDDPIARLRWKTNGVIIGNPEQLDDVAEEFTRLVKNPKLVAKWDEAKAMEPEVAEAAAAKKQQTALGGMIGNMV